MTDCPFTGNANPKKILSDKDFLALCKVIHQQTGITIAENRRNMLLSRLQRRLRATGTKTFKKYVALVTSNTVERQEMINRITTNETYFYRTPRIWSHLRDSTIPEFLEEGRAKTMNVWSAAASTGEEGYTIGAVLEDVRQHYAGFEYSVLGTDISTRVLKVACRGTYFGRSIARFRKEDHSLFEHYMIGNEVDGFSVRPEIGERIDFEWHNLLEPLKFARKFDVVFLRNVLIYFSCEDQERILSNVHDQMKRNGTLIIGESETLSNMQCDFEAIAPLIYRARLPSTCENCVM